MRKDHAMASRQAARPAAGGRACGLGFGALLGFAVLFWMAAVAPAGAAPAQSGATISGRATSADLSAHQRKRHGPTRLRVYRNFRYPAPNAVRQCEARYEQEHRQSGTVIVPRMHCWWQRG